MADQADPDPIAALADAARRDEMRRLDAVFRDTTGWQPRTWGRILGYGRYAYRYASGRTGEYLATGFAPRAREVSLYIMPGYTDYPDIAARLGPHRRGKACWYVKGLDAVDEAALRDLIRAGLDDLGRLWPIEPT